MKRIGLDIGGTSIKGAVIEQGELVFETKVLTNAKEGKDAILNALFRLIRMLQPYAPDAPIGIGSAGDIDPIEGRIIFASDNLPNFSGLPLRQLVEEKTGRSVTVINDAVAALIGEMIYGGAKGKKSVALLTLGTGLGGGIAINGKLLLGSHYQGGRVGHIELYPHGRACTCGKIGCAEQYVSATGLMTNAAQQGLNAPHSGEVFRLAQLGNAKAKRAVAQFLSDLARMIDLLHNLLDPDVILLGGGLVEVKDYWWDALLELVPPDLVSPAVLGNRAGVFGSQFITFDKSLF